MKFYSYSILLLVMMLAHLEIFSRVMFANVLQPRFLEDYLNEFNPRKTNSMFNPSSFIYSMKLLPFAYVLILLLLFLIVLILNKPSATRISCLFFNIGWLFDFRDFYRLVFRFPTLMPTESQRQKHTEGCLRLKKASE